MLRTIQAIIEPDGRVRLLEPLQLSEPHRALVTVLGEAVDEASDSLSALLREPALAEDWDRPEEDAAWAHLQPEA